MASAQPSPAAATRARKEASASLAAAARAVSSAQRGVQPLFVHGLQRHGGRAGALQRAAGVDGDADEPCLEVARLPQGADVAPRCNERILHGVGRIGVVAVQATGGDAVQGGAAGARQPLEGVRVAALGPAHETRQRSTVQGFRGHGCSLSLLRETRYPVRPLDASAPAQCDRPYGKLRALIPKARGWGTDRRRCSRRSGGCGRGRTRGRNAPTGG